MNQAFVNPNDNPARLMVWSEVARWSVLMMELLWLANWYDLLVLPQTSIAEVLLYLGALMIGTHLLARGMNYRKIGMGWRRLVLALWLVMVVLLSLSGLIHRGEGLTLWQLLSKPIQSLGSLTDDLRDFWHILLVIILAWRGISLARDAVGILSAQLSFQLGLVMMLFYGIGMGFTRPLEAALTLYAFLFFGLVAMSSARIFSVGDMRGGKLPAPGRRWMAGILLSAAAIVGSAVFAGWASSTWAADIVLQGYLLLFGLLIVLGLILISPIIVVLFWFSPELRELLSFLTKGSFLSGLMEFMKGVENWVQTPPEWVITGMQLGKPLVFGGILLLAALGLFLLLLWKPWQHVARREMGTSDLPFHPVFGLPRLLLNRLGNRLANSRRMIAAARVRWVYAQLMALCSALGQARPQAVTPIEFLPKLIQLFPAQASQLNQITQAYLKVRYGMYPESQEEVRDVELCWEQVKRVGKPLLRQHKQRLKKGG